MYEETIQRTYSPATTSNASTRSIPFEVQRRRDGAAFKLPTLQFMCLQVAASHFLTHVLPSREVFDRATDAPSSSSKAKLSASTVKTLAKRPRIVSRGIGGRPIMDAETAAGADFVPSRADVDSDDSDAGDDQVGIAASRTRRRSDLGPRSKSKQLSAPTASTDELRELHSENSQLLKMLPPSTKTKLLRLLRTVCPEALSRQVLVSHFIHGQAEVELDSAMVLFVQHPQEINLVLRSISSATISASPRPVMSVPLRRLSLSGLTRASAQALSSLFLRCHHLEEVVLKGCVAVGEGCMTALLTHNAKHLRVLNANFTDIGSGGVESVIGQAPELQVLKIANVLGLNDRAVPDLIMRACKAAQAANPPFSPLSRLHSLKLRGLELGDVSLTALFGLLTRVEAPLTSLDVSHIDLSAHRADSLANFLGYPMLDKGPVAIANPDHPEAPRVLSLRHMKKLNLAFTGSRTRVDNMSRLAGLVAYAKLATETLLLDGLAQSIVSALDEPGSHPLHVYWNQPQASYDVDDAREGEGFKDVNGWRAKKKVPWLPPIRRISLADTNVFAEDLILFPERDLHGAVKFSSVNGILLMLAEEVDLSRNQQLNVSHRSLFKREDTDGQPPLDVVLGIAQWETRVLNLSDTRLNDETLAVFAERCGHLERISLANTSVTSEGVRDLVAKCPFLTSIDLTGCRGVPVRERRNVFEYLEDEDGVGG